MPQAIPAIVAALKATAFTIGTYAVTYGTIAKVVLLAASIAYSSRQNRKMRNRLRDLRDSGTTASFADPTATGWIIYGEVRTGGTVIFRHTTGTKNEILWYVVVLAVHNCEEIGEVYFGDYALGMPFGTSNNNPPPGNRYRDFVLLNKKPNSGSADADLVAGTGGKWTTDHKLTNRANFSGRLVWSQDIYPTGVPQVSAMVRGKHVYDPRDGLTKYSKNVALVLRDYLVEWCKIDAADVPDADVIAAANICDETVDGAPRYEFNGKLSTSVPPEENIQDICEAMAGYLIFSGGQYRMFAGAYTAPVKSFDLGDLRAGIRVQTASPVNDSFNAVRALYVSPDNNWQTQPTPLVYKKVPASGITAGARVTIMEVGTTNFTAIGAPSNAVGVTFTATGPGTGTGIVDPYLGEDGGMKERRILDIQLVGTTDSGAAQRICRIMLERERQDSSFIAPFNLTALNLRPGDNIQFSDSTLGWSNKVFEVLATDVVFEERQSEGDGETVVAIGVDVTLRETASTVYSWTSSTDETTVDPAPDTDLPDPWTVANPTGLTLTSGTAALVKGSDGTIISRIKAEWTAPADPFVTSGGQIEVQYKLSSGSVWLTAGLLNGSDTIVYCGPVADGDVYDVRVRSINGLGVRGAWVTVTNHTVVGKTALPAAPTGLSATGIPGGIYVEWTTPNEADFSHTDLYVATSSTKPGSPTFKIPGVKNAKSTHVIEPLSSGDVRYVWAHSVDTSGNASTSAAGPANATALAAGGSAGPAGPGAWTPIGSGTATAEGSSIFKKTGTAAFNASVYSKDGFYRGAFCGVTCGALGDVAFGFDTFPNLSDANTSLEYSFRLWSGGQIDIVESGTTVASSIGVQVADTTRFAITYDNANVRYYVDGVLKRTVAASADLMLYFDSSLYTVNATNPLLREVAFGATGSVGAPGAAGAGYAATSTTSNFVGTGSKTWTLTPASGAWAVGQRVRAIGSAGNWMEGNVTAYNSGTGSITINVVLISGTGTFTSWTFSVSGEQGSTGATGPGYGGTSTTSLTLGTGSMTLTTQTGLAYVAGSRIRVANTADTRLWMEGVVTSYTSGTGSLTFTSELFVGTGTLSSWTLSLAGQNGTGGGLDGEWVSGGTYYHDSTRISVVYKTVSGTTTYYRANNPSKNNLNTWGDPASSSDWISAGTTLKFTATKLALFEDAIVTKTLTMGDGTNANAGIIRAHGATDYMTGAGYHINPRNSSYTNKATFRVGDPAGYYIAFDGTEVIQRVATLYVGDAAATDDGIGELQVIGDMSARKYGAGTTNAGVAVTVASGTNASPGATQSGQFAKFSLRGYDGTGSYMSSGYMRLRATDAWSPGFAPVEAVFGLSDGSANYNVTFTKQGRIQTEAPAGGTAAGWKLGTVATVSPTSPNRTIEVEINGTTYFLHAKTTNN